MRNIKSAYPGSRLAQTVQEKGVIKYKNAEREIDQIFEKSYIQEEGKFPLLTELESEIEEEPSKSEINEQEFFDQPIFLQLPDLPNATIASTLTPG